MAVRLYRVTLTKTDLLKLGEAEQKLFVIAAHIANDLSALQRILVGSMNHKVESEVSRQGFTVQNWIISKILAGKLHEAWNAMQRYYYSSLSEDYLPQLHEHAPEAEAAEESLARYFSRSNPVTRIRNEAAFHYSCDDVAEIIRDVQDEHSFVLYLGENVGNSLYFFAEELLFVEQFPQNSTEEVRAAFDVVINRMLSLAREFETFFQGCMFIALSKMRPGETYPRDTVPEAETIHLDDLEIPYFLDCEARAHPDVES